MAELDCERTDRGVLCVVDRETREVIASTLYDDSGFAWMAAAQKLYREVVELRKRLAEAERR